MKHIRKIFLFNLFVFSHIFAQEIEFSASVDKTEVGESDRLTYRLEVSANQNINMNSLPTPRLPNLSGFTIISGPNSSSNYQFTNGRVSVSKTIQYVMIPRKRGKIRIGSAVITFKGKTYKTEPIDINVVKGAPKPQTAQKKNQNIKSVSGEDLFVRAIVPKKEVYVGEPLIVSYRIYTRVTITSYSINKLPNTAGFWTEEFPTPNQPSLYDVTINNKRYKMAEIKKTALFPTKYGTLTIDPFQVSCDVRAQQKRRSRSLFDSFFDDPFFTRTVKKEVMSKPIKIEVLPFPAEGKPRDFAGLAGSYKITATTDKQQLKTNGAFTLKVKISGTGNIRIIPEPRINFPPSFEVYDPETKENISRKNNRISGSQTFEYVIIPRATGEYAIPSLQISYFNPSEKKYKLSKTSPIALIVERGKEETEVFAGSGYTKNEIELVNQDIRFIKKQALTFHKNGDALYQTPWFILILLIPFAGVGGSSLYRKYLNKMQGDVAYARNRKAHRMARNRLKNAKEQLSLETQKMFYSEISKALLGFLGNKLNIAEAGIITDEVETLLKGRNVSEDIIKMYLDCLKMCDYARFSPADPDETQMRKLLEDSEEAIVQLDRKL